MCYPSSVVVDRLLAGFVREAGHPLRTTYGRVAEALYDVATLAHLQLERAVDREALRQGVLDHVKGLNMFHDPEAIVNAAWNETSPT